MVTGVWEPQPGWTNGPLPGVDAQRGQALLQWRGQESSGQEKGPPSAARGGTTACAPAEGRASAVIQTFDATGSSAHCPHAGRAREPPSGVWEWVRTGRQRLRRERGSRWSARIAARSSFGTRDAKPGDGRGRDALCLQVGQPGSARGRRPGLRAPARTLAWVLLQGAWPHAHKQPAQPAQATRLHAPVPAAGIQGWQRRMGTWGSASDLPWGNGEFCSQGQPPSSRCPESGGAVDRAGGAPTHHPAGPPHHGRAVLTHLTPDARWAKLNLPLEPLDLPLADGKKRLFLLHSLLLLFSSPNPTACAHRPKSSVMLWGHFYDPH